MEKKKILISGATGLVGSSLSQYLETNDMKVIKLTRNPKSETDIFWDPTRSALDVTLLEGLDTVVHLAGENISNGRWTHKQKAKILESRKQGTKLLSESLAKLSTPPKALISASGINYYHRNSDKPYNESSSIGSSFLSKVCDEWEKGTEAAEKSGIRVCHLRIGVVLSKNGGALPKMLLPMRLGLGGIIGSGKQHMSWIALDDLVKIIHNSIINEKWTGIVNAVSEKPVTNKDFTKELARILKRPALFPLPSLIAKLIFGQMAEETLLADLPVYSSRFDELEFELSYPNLSQALTHLLGSS